MEDIKVLISPELEGVVGAEPATSIIVNPEDINQFKELGFYYIFNTQETEPEKIEELIKPIKESIAVIGVEESYAIEKAKYKQECLLETKGEVANSVNALKLLLSAAYSNDLEKLADIIETSYDVLNDNTTKLQTLFGEVDKDVLWELKASKLRKANSELRSKLKEQETLMEEYDSIKDKLADMADLREQINTSDKRLDKLRAELATMTTKMESMHSDEDYEQLQQELEEANREIEERSHGAQTTDKFSGNDIGNNELISRLKEEIIKLQADNASLVKPVFPIINKDCHIESNDITYIQECAPVGYLESLMLFLYKFHVTGKYMTTKKSFCCIVFDKLDNEYRVDKYRSLNFGINEKPTFSKPVVVTNNFSIDNIKNFICINSFDRIVIIDRLGIKGDLIEGHNCDCYYTCSTDETNSSVKAKDSETFGIKNKDNILYSGAEKAEYVNHIDINRIREMDVYAAKYLKESSFLKKFN